MCHHNYFIINKLIKVVLTHYHFLAFNYFQDLDFPDKTDITFLTDIFMKLVGDRVEDPVNFRDQQFTSGYTGTKGSEDAVSDL